MVSMDRETLRFISDNVIGATDEMIELAYEKHNKDVLETISYLLEIPKPVEKPKTEWEERREICDAHDAEMQKFMNNLRIRNQPPAEPSPSQPQPTNIDIVEKHPTKKIKLNPILETKTI